MNEKDAWKNFVTSGSVDDYLKYASIKNDRTAPTEEQDENNHRRIGHQRTKPERTGQGSDGSHLG
ncbi:MAG: hypothetical protein II685_05470 [Clostridia bacterium]|nr:hypothetical protein [Clostridia bacterium]